MLSRSRGTRHRLSVGTGIVSLFKDFRGDPKFDDRDMTRYDNGIISPLDLGFRSHTKP